MTTQKPLMGLCPIGKFVFSNEDAVRCKRLLQQKLDHWQIPCVDLDDVLEDGLVKDQKHVGPAVEHFQAAGVDCLFVPHCNFGTEGAVGMIASKLALPTLLWGPRDEAPLADGTRLRDTLCGMFASSKVLRKLGVPFTYIENCRIDEPAFEQGVDRFLRAASVARAFRNGIRIGHLGQRIDFFWTTIVNESELLQRFNIEVLPLDMVTFIDAVRRRVEMGRRDYADRVAELRRACTIEGIEEDLPLMNILAVADEMLAQVEWNGLDGLAVQDFTSIVDAMGAYCFFADSLAADQCAVGYESDILGAVSNVLLMRADFNNQPAFLADLTVRHPENDNGILVWHAGAPTAMCHPDDKIRLGRHWILPSPLSGMTHFRLKDGPITLARMDGEHGDYRLAVGEAQSIDGPWTQNNYLWAAVNNWPAWERALMEGPFMHHTGMIYGHYADALIEACKYVPGLQPLRLGQT